MLDYTNSDFDISTIEGFNNIDGLAGISNYIDFALSSTIHKQKPNVDIATEKMYAKDILKRYLQGDLVAFTSTYGIRGNINKVSQKKIKDILLKSLIELNAYNQRVLHQLGPNDYIGECAQYVTAIAANGQLDQIQPWLNDNMNTFVENYIDTRYKESSETKEQMETIAHSIPDNEKALEQLNLEMKLNQFKTK